MTKRKALLIAAIPALVLLLSAQTFGPAVFSPFLTIGSGAKTTSGLRVNGDVTITGTCTGCPTTPVGGSDTQVQYNNAGALAGDAGLTYNAATDALAVTGNVTSAGNSVCTAAGGAAGCHSVHAFTLNFTTACTTTPTMLMSAAKFGTMVSMRVNGTMSSCTSDSTSFSTSADVPAALRPDANACFSIGNGASDNGLAVSALFCIQTDGTVVIQECPLDGVAGFGCASSTWVASGTKFLSGFQQVFTYDVDQS